MTLLLLEQEIIDRARRGDPDAFEAVVTTYRYPLREHLYGMLATVPGATREDAADLAQDALVKAWLALPKLTPAIVPIQFKGWLFTIAHRVGLDEVRHRKKVAFQSWDAFVDEYGETHPDIVTDDIPHLAALRAEDAAEMRVLLAQLPEHYRRVMVLRYYADRSLTEVGHLLGLSQKAAKTRLYRAHSRLREMYLASPRRPQRPAQGIHLQGIRRRNQRNRGRYRFEAFTKRYGYPVVVGSFATERLAIAALQAWEAQHQPEQEHVA